MPAVPALGPIVDTADRFALARPHTSHTGSDEEPSPPGVRPFGLRFAADPLTGDAPLPSWRYDPERQLAVDPGNGAPWYRSLVDMTMKTTGYSTDGGSSTGNEEYRPDYLSEESA
ncbi:MAG: putative ATP-grasp-modified RiPP [Micromonosporaceae bacterium]|nr:putative ATP-grasp-modified RiPP [Micromonosporaceae bacterium]